MALEMLSEAAGMVAAMIVIGEALGRVTNFGRAVEQVVAETTISAGFRELKQGWQELGDPDLGEAIEKPRQTPGLPLPSICASPG